MAGTTGDDSETSSSLLSRVRALDEDAWRDLVRWIGPTVLRWCLRAGVEASRAEDVAQDVFVRIWNGLPQFRRDRPGQSFRSWAYTITRHAIIDLFRDRHRPLALPDHLPAEEDATEATSLRRDAIQLLVRECTARYEKDRGFMAFKRTAVDGLTAREVGDELGLSDEAVRKHKARWTQRLRELLERRFSELLD